jgi:flavodoxin
MVRLARDSIPNSLQSPEKSDKKALIVIILGRSAMKALVTYYTETGNTEKLAKAIFEGLEGPEKEIKPMAEVSAVDKYDPIFCGFPVQSHSVPGKAAAFIKSIPKGKKVAFFSTHGSYRGGELAIQAFYYTLSLATHLKVLGTFGCRGKVNPKLLDQLMKQAEHQAWAEEAQTAVDHPNAADFEDGKNWAQKMKNKAMSR